MIALVLHFKTIIHIQINLRANVFYQLLGICSLIHSLKLALTFIWNKKKFLILHFQSFSYLLMSNQTLYKSQNHL